MRHSIIYLFYHQAILILLFSLFPRIDTRFNYFSCGNTPPWEVDNNVSVVEKDIKMFYEWIYAWQHNPKRCNHLGYDSWSANYGLGNGYTKAAVTFERALEYGRIYRPTQDYFWASNSENCVFNATYFDCYMQELSSCGLKLTSQTDVEPMDKNDDNTALGILLGGKTTTVDICRLAKVMKKSMAWVAGQYMAYIIRPRQDLKVTIEERMKGIFDTVDKKAYSTIAVHYRSGHPDFNRKVLTLDRYMIHVNQKANELAAEGRPVSVVYLASQSNNHSFHNISYLNERYGTNYTLKFLVSHASNQVNVLNELEYELKSNPRIPRQPFVAEFLTDINLFTEADCFIGSISNIFTTTILLRHGKYPYRDKKYTCIVNMDSNLVCNDDSALLNIFNRYPLWITDNSNQETEVGSFTGGTPF